MGGLNTVACATLLLAAALLVTLPRTAAAQGNSCCRDVAFGVASDFEAASGPRMSRDAVLHYTLSAASGAIATQLTLRVLSERPAWIPWIAGIAIGALPGLAKEVYDAGRDGNRFSGTDLAWDLLGTATGATLAVTCSFSW